MPCDIHKLSLRFTSNIAIIISHHFIKAVIQGATSYHLYKCFRTNSGRDWLPSRLTDLSAYNLIPLPNERISRCFLILKLLSHSATTSPNRSYRFISEPSRQMAWFLEFPYLRQSSSGFLRQRHQGVWLVTTFIVTTIWMQLLTTISLSTRIDHRRFSPTLNPYGYELNLILAVSHEYQIQLTTRSMHLD